ncbi:hypothetical protein F5Y18DRAFT_410210 [Xylariaceae sp. FL1019]|nr:hypothetical protein F5Y18DRAFT_410210 [Xylariaceae sp. FL1019]
MFSLFGDDCQVIFSLFSGCYQGVIFSLFGGCECLLEALDGFVLVLVGSCQSVIVFLIASKVSWKH